MKQSDAVREKTEELAAFLLEEPAVLRFREAKDALREDENARTLTSGFSALQRRAQMEMLSRGAVSEELEQQINGLYAALQQSDAAVEFLLAESALHALMGEIYQTLGRAAGIEPSFSED